MSELKRETEAQRKETTAQVSQLTCGGQGWPPALSGMHFQLHHVKFLTHYLLGAMF